jgi:hypothetical protein
MKNEKKITRRNVFFVFCLVFSFGFSAGVLAQKLHIPGKILDNVSDLFSENTKDQNVPGCTDTKAYNYQSNANEDDNSCVFDICGNIEGLQETIPQGYEKGEEEGTCVISISFQQLNNVFGDPVEITGPRSSSYSTPPNSDFLKNEISIHDYPFGESITSQVDFFTGDWMEKERDEIIENNKSASYREIIRSQLGMEIMDFGEIIDTDNEVIVQDESHRITYYQLTFSNGPIAQFYIAEPLLKNNGKVLLAIHGCSSSPDKVLGLTEMDYTNQFGKVALEEGWTVIAPFILTKCEVLDNMDALGTYYAGATSFGYELNKLINILDFVSTSYEFSSLDVYGISFGAQLAALLVHVSDYDIQNIIFSGSMNFDLYASNLINAKKLKDDYSYRSHPVIYRFFSIGDLLSNFLKQENTKLVVEIGAFDALNKINKSFIEENLGLIEKCNSEFNDCSNRLLFNYFKGGHETNPYPSLAFIK